MATALVCPSGLMLPYSLKQDSGRRYLAVLPALGAPLADGGILSPCEAAVYVAPSSRRSKAAGGR
jgi:hypothetical protein